jgi:NADPH-dependent curcumin reductase
MPEPRNRRWMLARKPKDPLDARNFRWTEEPAPQPRAGQMVVRNLWLSYDPTLILFLGTGDAPVSVPVGGVVRSWGVGEVVASRLTGFRPGDLVWGRFGWEDYSVDDGKAYPGLPAPQRLEQAVDPRIAAGTFGWTGMAAYFGMMSIGRPRRGETCVVSGAAGGVGSIAGQIARIHGMRVIGIAGGKEKGRRLVRELGFHATIDYKSEDVGARLSKLCPDGIDLYFDNVGGPILDLVLTRLRPHGRIVLCGITSLYLEDEFPPGPAHLTSLILQNGRMEGFMAMDYAAQYPAARRDLQRWIRSGALTSAEDVVEGLEQAPETLRRLFSGGNFGKQMLHIADRTTAIRRTVRRSTPHR